MLSPTLSPKFTAKLSAKLYSGLAPMLSFFTPRCAACSSPLLLRSRRRHVPRQQKPLARPVRRLPPQEGLSPPLCIPPLH
jgi:hypothetical protein